MRIATIILALVVFTTGHASAQSQATDLDKEIEKLLEAVGGKETWENATGFIMDEILYSTNYELPVIRKYWVDFKTPRIREHSKTAGLENVNALNEDHGWTMRNGALSAWEDNTVNGWRSFWPGIPTRIFHLLASDDPSLSYKWRDGVIDFFIDGQRVVWIATDERGTPVAYGRDERHTITHFLGKPLQYGDTVLWSEATEPGGAWRVIMVDYELLTESHTVSFAPPEE